MKIYEIGTGYTPIPAKMGAATEIVVEELTKSFMKLGKDVSIIDIKTSDRVPISFPIIEVSVPAIFTKTDIQLGLMHKFKRVIYSINLAIVLKKIIKCSKEKVIIHFHNQYNMFFFLKMSSLKLRSKCFIAYTNHSYIWHDNWEEIKETIKKRYFQELFSMQKADRIYVLNDNTKQTLINHIKIDEDRIQLIDNGVNTDIYYPQNCDEINSFKNELKINGKKVFLQIGSICDRKNQIGAVELLLPLLKTNPEFIFIYAGGIISKEYQEKIVKYASANGIANQVKYIGELKPGRELNKYYNIADVMVFPSKSEGFSLVIIEAMSAGIPVIVNENLQFKLSDLCLKYKDKNSFLKLIKEQILDTQRRKELSVNIRSAVVANYSWDRIAADYFNI